jgi:hypothetical protein
MVLGDLARTRRLCGNPSTTNVSDADITQGLTYGTSRVISWTGKTNWETDTTHVDYASAVMAAEYFASSMIRDRFEDQSDISTEHFRRAENILRDVTNSLTNTSGAGSVRGIYRSYPLNSSATIYRSMFSSGQYLVGIGEYVPL